MIKEPIDKILELDHQYIYQEQKETINFVLNTLDISKIAFVGGVADYLNLRQYYQMPVNDLDIIFENEEDLEPIKDQSDLQKFRCSFYQNDKVKEVFVSEYFVNERRVHIDYFKRNFGPIRLTKSPLLGTIVYHASFEEMKKFHNNQIPLLTSKNMGEKYEWKRLYKHSRKASLYNNIEFLKEKNSL
ncbi:hypothetical protein [Aquimarina brevivitae]|uniref:Uncharacterized protein n=1 Tax=Aquimarina brevivitae TaxID=323412 RepID=A0A4Q7NYX8_9FLAO|nr:hypothetical protein [Aquimarina brevivitae]RZS92504.1 hypothetical protein EV197_2642 [Aquimarina brevivitae]